MSRTSARSEWKALETVHTRASANVRLASPESDWNGIAASRFRLGQADVSLPPLGVPAFGVNYGEPLRLEIESFLGAVEGGPVRVTGEDGRRALELAVEITNKIREHTDRAGI